MKLIDVLATGKNIRKIRTEKQISVDKIADACLLTRQSIYHWEHGTSLPALDTLILLSDVLETPINDILIINQV